MRIKTRRGKRGGGTGERGSSPAPPHGAQKGEGAPAARPKQRAPKGVARKGRGRARGVPDPQGRGKAHGGGGGAPRSGAGEPPRPQQPPERSEWGAVAGALERTEGERRAWRESGGHQEGGSRAASVASRVHKESIRAQNLTISADHAPRCFRTLG